MAAAVPRGPGLFCRIFTGVNSGRALGDDWKRRSCVEQGGWVDGRLGRSKGLVFETTAKYLSVSPASALCSLFLHRRDSNLVKEEIKTFLNNRRISQAIVGQVTGTLNGAF